MTLAKGDRKIRSPFHRFVGTVLTGDNMIELLLTIALLLPGVERGVKRSELHAVIEDVSEVASTEEPLNCSEDRNQNIECTAKILLVWSFFESAWKPYAHSGPYIGVMQVHRAHLHRSTKEVLKSRQAGLREGLRVLRNDVTDCGSIREGLNRYSSGDCKKKLHLVKMRCSFIGC